MVRKLSCRRAYCSPGQPCVFDYLLLVVLYMFFSVIYYGFYTPKGTSHRHLYPPSSQSSMMMEHKQYSVYEGVQLDASRNWATLIYYQALFYHSACCRGSGHAIFTQNKANRCRLGDWEPDFIYLSTLSSIDLLLRRLLLPTKTSSSYHSLQAGLHRASILNTPT